MAGFRGRSAVDGLKQVKDLGAKRRRKFSHLNDQPALQRISASSPICMALVVNRQKRAKMSANIRGASPAPELPNCSPLRN